MLDKRGRAAVKMNMFTFIKSLPDPLPGKADRTRDRILKTALTLFEKKGYENATMREIATQSDSSLGLAYRYFSSKEELVLAFYQSLSGQFLAQISELPKGKLAQRFTARMQNAFERIVRESEDAPAPSTSAALAKLLYVMHLALLYFRVNDRSEGGRATRELLAWIEKALSYLPFASQVPLFSEGLLQLAASLDIVFGGHADEHAAT